MEMWETFSLARAEGPRLTAHVVLPGPGDVGQLVTVAHCEEANDALIAALRAANRALSALLHVAAAHSFSHCIDAPLSPARTGRERGVSACRVCRQAGRQAGSAKGPLPMVARRTGKCVWSGLGARDVSCRLPSVPV